MTVNVELSSPNDDVIGVAQKVVLALQNLPVTVVVHSLHIEQEDA